MEVQLSTRMLTGQNKIQIKIFLSSVDSQFLLSPNHNIIIHE